MTEKEEKSIYDKLKTMPAGTSVNDLLDLVRVGVATLIKNCVEEERQRCAACAQYELDASEARAEHAEKLEWAATHKQGAAVAKWIKKAILRGDKEQTYRYKP